MDYGQNSSVLLANYYFWPVKCYTIKIVRLGKWGLNRKVEGVLCKCVQRALLPLPLMVRFSMLEGKVLDCARL